MKKVTRKLDLYIGENSLSPLVITHLHHCTSRLGLHEEDLGDVTVLAHQVKQAITVDLTHGEIMNHNNTRSLITTTYASTHHVLIAWTPTHHVHIPHTGHEVTTSTSTTSNSTSSTHIHHVWLIENNRSCSRRS